MSDNSLVRIEQQDIVKGGQGFRSSRLFELKPATVVINQNMTTADGAIPGKLRIVETGDQFDEMRVVLLDADDNRRDYYIGQPGQLNRKQENLMCFSRDGIRPDPRAREPQALECKGCPRSDWSRWEENKKKTGLADAALAPSCEKYTYALFIDTVYKMPLQMYIRGGNKKIFEAAMQNLSRKFALLRSQNLNPNIWDLSFTLSTAPGSRKGIYVLKIDGKSFKAVNEEERKEFGGFYMQYVNHKRKFAEDYEHTNQSETQVDSVTKTIEAQIMESGSDPNAVDGEIVI